LQYIFRLISNIKLSKSKKLVLRIKYNIILIIVKRLAKYNNFVLYKKANIAKELAYIINQIIIANYKMLDIFIINKDKFFILKF
jgi:hypothetical protein